MLSFNLDVSKAGFRLSIEADLPAQGVTGLIGVSGAGKSTLLRGLAGLEEGCCGFVSFNDQQWFDSDRQLNLPLHKRSIGIVFQRPSLLPHLNVQGNLDYAWNRVPLNRRIVSISEAIEWLDIQDLLHRQPHQLSGGEAQRVAIARGLCANPDLLLMDEPLAAVDISGRNEILRLLEGMKKKLTMPILYVSHALDEVGRLADQLLIMERGRLLAQGPVDEMLTRFDLPLAHAADAEAILDVLVDSYDESNQISQLGGSAGTLYVTQSLPPGSRQRLRIGARDVSIALSHAVDSSILNILPATIIEISAENSGQNLLKLQVGDAVILARLSQQSVNRLNLTVGMSVFAQIKAVSLV